MSDKASIVDPHVKVGIVAGDGGTAIWPLAIGPAVAKQYLLTGDPVPAQDALRLGLINFVSPPESVVEDALNTSFDFATASEIVTFQSDDYREALAALAENREPRFKGK